MSHVQALRCNFCGGGYENYRCSSEGSNEEAKVSNFQRNNPYSNTYNPGWKDHPNFRWVNNKNLGATQGIQQS